MGNIGSHVDITSERRGHQAKLGRGRVSLPRLRMERIWKKAPTEAAGCRIEGGQEARMEIP
jgi:hypothetical protein